MTKREEMKAKLDKLDTKGRSLELLKVKYIKEGKSTKAIEKQIAANQIKRFKLIGELGRATWTKAAKKEAKEKKLKVKPRGSVKKAGKRVKTQRRIKKR